MMAQEKKSVGRPKGVSKYTTLIISVTYEEAEKIKKAHKKFEEKNGVKIAKSQFIRSQLEILK